MIENYTDEDVQRMIAKYLTDNTIWSWSSKKSVRLKEYEVSCVVRSHYSLIFVDAPVLKMKWLKLFKVSRKYRHVDCGAIVRDWKIPILSNLIFRVGWIIREKDWFMLDRIVEDVVKLYDVGTFEFVDNN